MPLQSGPGSFKSNVRTLMGEVGKSPHVQSRQQALAIAYAKQRQGRADGGALAGVRNLPLPGDDAMGARLIPMSPSLPAYIRTIESMHRNRMRAQGIPPRKEDRERYRRGGYLPPPRRYQAGGGM